MFVSGQSMTYGEVESFSDSSPVGSMDSQYPLIEKCWRDIRKLLTAGFEDSSQSDIREKSQFSSSEIIFPHKHIADLFSHVHRTYFPELYEALDDLGEVSNEAVEEGFVVPSGKASDNAKRLLTEMYAISSRRYEVYPTPDGEIAIDAPGGPGRSVILLCASDGGALCLVNMNGRHRRARYSSTERLPDGFIREALTELKQEDG